MGSWSRYYIMCFWASLASFRIIKSLFFPNFNVIYLVTIGGFIFRLIFGIVFIFYGNDVISLFVVYVLLGFSGSATLPGLLTWVELIRPTTGLISCSWWIFYGIGDAAMSFSMGSLIEIYGASVMPVAVAVAVGFGLLFNILAVVTFTTLKLKESK